MTIAQLSSNAAIPSTGSASDFASSARSTHARRWSAGTIIGRLMQWQARNTERNHLRQLDDRMLSDMGMTRADAYHESRKPFWLP